MVQLTNLSPFWSKEWGNSATKRGILRNLSLTNSYIISKETSSKSVRLTSRVIISTIITISTPVEVPWSRQMIEVMKALSAGTISLAHNNCLLGHPIKSGWCKTGWARGRSTTIRPWWAGSLKILNWFKALTNVRKITGGMGQKHRDLNRRRCQKCLEKALSNSENEHS